MCYHLMACKLKIGQSADSFTTTKPNMMLLGQKSRRKNKERPSGRKFPRKKDFENLSDGTNENDDNGIKDNDKAAISKVEGLSRKRKHQCESQKQAENDISSDDGTTAVHHNYDLSHQPPKEKRSKILDGSYDKIDPKCKQINLLSHKVTLLQWN